MNLPQTIEELLKNAAIEIANDNSPYKQMLVTGTTLAKLRDLLPSAPALKQRLSLLDLSLTLESAFFTASSTLTTTIREFSRKEQIGILLTCIDAIYGAGLMTKRQQIA